MSKRRPKVKARRVWGIRPATRVHEDKTKLPWRKRKHKSPPHE